MDTPMKSAACITRHPKNPLLTWEQIPYPAALVFNAGITKFNGKYVMVFRNDVGTHAEKRLHDGTNIGLAYSDDGIAWDVAPEPCFNLHDDEIIRAYDPRLTVVEGRCYMCFAVDTKHGLRGGLAVTDDFKNWDILSMSAPDNRNMVLFPERINGNLARLERPFPIYSRPYDERFDIWYAESPDGKYWGNNALVLGVENVPFSDTKIGPAAPPIKTDKGWLTTFHAVDTNPDVEYAAWHDGWHKRYTAGLMLLDLENPSKVIGISREPLIAPEVPYETDEGFRTQVIFPGGMILEDDGQVKIYYGAADTCECLATADVNDLLALCTPC